MNMHIPQPMQLPALITGVAAILFSTVAMTKAPIAGWRHTVVASADETATQPPLGGSTQMSGHRKVRAKPKCNECGVVESMHRVSPEGNSPAIYEIKVRMRDGSTHVSRDANAANWHRGDQIILLGGT